MKESKKPNSLLAKPVALTVEKENISVTGSTTRHADKEKTDLAAGIGIIVLNSELDVILFSPAVLEMLRITPKQKENLLVTIAGRFADSSMMDDMNTALKEGESVERIVRTTDHTAYIISISPSITPEKEVSGVILSLIDITQRIIEEETKVSESAAIAANEETVETMQGNSRRIEAQMTADLYQSNKRYDQLVNSIDEGYCVIKIVLGEHDKPVDYIFLELNKAFSRQTGIENASGKSMRFLSPGHEQHWFDIYGSIALTGKALRFQNKAEELDRIFDVYAFRTGEPKERKVAVLFNDITEQKRAENNLAFLSEITRHLIYTEDVDQMLQTVGEKISSYLKLSHCVFVKVNESGNEAKVICDWHIVNVPDLTGTYYLTDFTTPEFQRFAREGKSLVVNNVALYNSSKESYYRVLCVKSFISVPLIINNEWQFFMSVCHSEPRNWRTDEINLIEELTARIWTTLKRKQTEKDLRQSEERLRLTIAAGKVGTCDHNLKTDQAICNATRYKMYGLIPQAEPIDVSVLFACVHPDDASSVKREFENGIKTSGRHAEEYRVVHSDGTIRWISQTGQVIEWEDGEPVRVLSILSDITEHKMEEKQKDDFISVASHELKTPVTSIKAYTHILEYTFRLANDEHSASLMSRLNGQVDRLTSLIINMLDTTKISEGHLQLNIEAVDIAALLQEAIEDIRHTSAYHNIQLTAASLPTIRCDKKRMGQVFTNLLSNAIKYTPVGHPSMTTTILVNAVYVNAEIKISFQDFGIGMSSGTLAHLFQRFFRSDKPEQHTYPGLGLGLYISKEIMKRHGGDITVTSKKRKGSIFTVVLPAGL